MGAATSVGPCAGSRNRDAPDRKQGKGKQGEAEAGGEGAGERGGGKGDGAWADRFDGGGRTREAASFGKPPEGVRRLRVVVKRARNLFGTTAPVPTLVEATLAHQNGASAVAGDGEGAANVPGLFRNVLGQNTRALRNPTYADADFTFDAFQPWAGASLLIELRGSAANNGAPRAFAGRLRIPVDRVASVGEGDEPPPPSWCRLTDRPPGEKDAGVAWAETIGAKAVEGAESSQELPDSAVTVRVFCDDNDRHRVYVAVERSEGVWLSRPRVKVSLVYQNPEARPDKSDAAAEAEAQRAAAQYEEGLLVDAGDDVPTGPTLGPFVTAPPKLPKGMPASRPRETFEWDDKAARFSFWPVCHAKQPWVLLELSGIPHDLTPAGGPRAPTRAGLAERAARAAAAALSSARVAAQGGTPVAQLWRPVSVELKADAETVPWNQHRFIVRKTSGTDDDVPRGSLNFDATMLGARGDRMQVVVIKAQGLPAVSDQGVGCDAYVVVSLGQKRFRTTVKRATTNPAWQEALQFQFSECFPSEKRGGAQGFGDVLAERLTLEVYHSNNVGAGGEGANDSSDAVFLGLASYVLSDFDDSDDGGDSDGDDEGGKRPGERDASAVIALLDAGADFGERYAMARDTAPKRSFWAALRRKGYAPITGEVEVACYFDDSAPPRPLQDDPVLRQLRRDALDRTIMGNDEGAEGEADLKREREKMAKDLAFASTKRSFKLSKKSLSPKKGADEDIDAELEQALMEVFQLAAKRERASAVSKLKDALERKSLREEARGEQGTEFYRAMEAQRRAERRKAGGSPTRRGGRGGGDDELFEDQRRRLAEALPDGGALLAMVSAYDGPGPVLMSDFATARAKVRWASEALGSMAPTVAPAF